MSLVRRTIASTGWNVFTSIARVVIGFVRTVLLARLLAVDVFGIYGFTSAVVSVSAVVASLGMAGAFLHRAPETEDEDRAAAVYFTLSLLFASVWAVLLAAGAFLFAEGPDRTALLVLTLTQFGGFLVQTPRAILVRRVVHRRLAVLQLTNLVLSSIAALFLAWMGAGLWALLATNLVTLMLSVIFLYLWKPVWTPRVVWAPSEIRYFLRFGTRNVLAELLLRALDQVDDLWTGAYLGDSSLGFYSRAYAFATYPRLILAESVNRVAGGTYAEVAKDRKQLSRVFFRINALLIRSGFLLAGMLALVSPEFVRLMLGAKWLPMLSAFRLMLVFTMLDPIKVTVGNLFVAVGKPEKVVYARLAQLVVLVVGLFLLGPLFDITGVAVAVDVMLVVGMAILLWHARAHVDFALRRLLAAPGVALVLGLMLASGAASWLSGASSDWSTGLLKTAVFVFTYALVLLTFERREFLQMLSLLTRYVSGWAGGELL